MDKLQNLYKKAYATSNNYGILNNNIDVISSTKNITIFKIIYDGIYEVNSDAYISSDDVFIKIFKNNSQIALQRTQTTGCVSCSAIFKCNIDDEIKIQSTAPGYEFNYSINMIDNYIK